MTRYILSLFILFSINAEAQPEKYVPFNGEEQTISLTTGVKLKYVEQGDPGGIPLILLHGFTDSWHSFEMVLPHLPSDLHVFALTQRGHGDADKPAAGYHPQDFAADVAAFMRQKHLNKAIIAGHSMGGMVAQQFALDHPEMVKALVIAASDASFTDNPGVPEFSAAINVLPEEVSAEFVSEFQQYTCAQPIDTVYYNLLVKESMKLPGSVWKAAMNGMLETDLSGRLKKIGSPVLILWGNKDVFCTKEDQEKMIARFHDVNFITYAGVGHALQWEQPKRFADDVSVFIRQKLLP